MGERHRQLVRASRPVRRRAIALLDVLVGGILLGAALAVIVGIGNNALRAQIEGEDMTEAAMALDSLLSDVLIHGPESYGRQFPTDGSMESPFDRFDFNIQIEDQGAGNPYIVTARVYWDEGRRSEVAQTWIAPRLGEDPDPEREPPSPVERQ
ncbi:MAG: hypothetical protein ACF8PN_02105 [Phycisphaerales bacterium]